MADEQEERKRVGVAREYRDGRISVYWAPEFCIHTARCINAQPQVFDPMRRPWVVLDDAGADAIAQAVRSCPTGALTYSRNDGGPEEVVPERLSVEPWPNGPLFLRGPVQVVDEHGSVVREATRVALCRCGGSENKPYCDGTHRAIGFQA